jgi:hypothetical protein
LSFLTQDGALDWLDTDDTVEKGEEVVDVLWLDLPVTSENLFLCIYCSDHSNCKDNEVPGANLTMYDACVKEGCCSMPQGNPPGALAQIASSETTLVGEAQAQASEQSCSMCDAYSMCTSPGSAFDACSAMGCCEGMDDPNDATYVPPPIDYNSTSYNGGPITENPEETVTNSTSEGTDEEDDATATTTPPMN